MGNKKKKWKMKAARFYYQGAGDQNDFFGPSGHKLLWPEGNVMCMFILFSCKSQKRPCVLTYSIFSESHFILIFSV